jgi:hypothetical protein
MTMRNVKVARMGDKPGMYSAMDGQVASLLIDLGEITYELTPHASGSGFQLRVAATSMGNVELQATSTTQHILEIEPVPTQDRAGLGRSS